MIYVWGAGEGRHDAYSKLQKDGIDFDSIQGIVDSNLNLWGHQRDGLPIFNPNILTTDDIIYIGSMYCREIFLYCMNNGIECRLPNYLGWVDEGAPKSQSKSLEYIIKNAGDLESKRIFKNLLKQREAGGKDPFFFEESKFPQYEHPAIIYKKGENLIEAGGYDGLTAIHFAHKFDLNVHTFDPDPANFKKLLNNVSNDQRIFPNNLALSSKVGSSKISAAGARSSIVELPHLDGYTCETTTIDKYAIERNIVVHHIKLDVEGHEIQAIEGALDTIAKYSPTLSVAIYHNPTDPVKISEFLMGHLKNYSFYFGHHSQWLLESMIYCIPPKSS